jgi:hypothetical protein
VGLSATLTLTLTLACTAADPALRFDDGCQPLLDGSSCLLPFPSDFFRADGAVTLTPAASLRSTRDAGPASPLDALARAPDGFSRLGPVALRLGGPTTLDGLVRVLDDPRAAARDDSATLLLDVDADALVPHVVDLDDRDPSPDTRALVLRPVAPLAPGHRHVVAVRGVRGPDGAPAPPGAGFARLRDRTGADVPALAAIADAFERDVFAPLARRGVDRAALQLAFTFTVRSDDEVRRDLLEVRAATLAWLAARPAALRIDRVDDAPSARTWRAIEGSFDAPMFLDKTGAPARLRRDADGHVVAEGTVRVPFSARVPTSLRDRFGPGRALMLGHGFFGGREELDAGASAAIADATGAVLLGADGWGMSREDLLVVVDDLVNQPASALRFADRVHQAMANWIVLAAIARGPLAEHPALRRPATPGAPGTSTSTAGASNAGRPLYDARALDFLGISQGHILGGVHAALNPALDRVVLDVGGAGFASLMARARPFAPFLVFLEQSLPSATEQLAYTLLAQLALDAIDPGNWAELVTRTPLDGAAPRPVLVRAGLGDTQVPNDGTFRHARALGLPLLAPAPDVAVGVPSDLARVDAPYAGSALAVFDFGLDVAPLYGPARAPDDENPVHDRLRATPEAIAQLRAFLGTGVIMNPCAPRACRLGL